VGNTDLFQRPVTTGYIWHCRKLGQVRGVMGLMVIPFSRNNVMFQLVE